MNEDFFDHLARSYASGVTRRTFLKLLLGGLGSGVLAALGIKLRQNDYLASGAEEQAGGDIFLPFVRKSCEVASRCEERVYCAQDQTCLCLQTPEGDIRCGKIPSTCNVQLCQTSADCANLGEGYFCDTPNSGCCYDPPAELPRCIAPCVPPCPAERDCDGTCCPAGQYCIGGACVACTPEQYCTTQCCPEGEYCVRGACVPCTPERYCVSYCCAEGQICLDGFCVYPELTCPTCAPCQTCDVDSVTGEYNCAECQDACHGTALCQQANKDASFVKLSQHLDKLGFVPDQGPQELVLNLDGAWTRSVLGIYYTHPTLADETAYLFYGEEATGETGTYAIRIRAQETKLGYFVNASGQVEEITPPWGASSQAFSLEPLFAAADSCGVLCNFSCDLVTGILCALATAAICSFSGPGVALCGWVIGTTCGVVATATCLAICDQFICKPPPKFCFCNKKCYSDVDVCLNECKPGLGCFTGICRPATPGDCLQEFPG